MDTDAVGPTDTSASTGLTTEDEELILEAIMLDVVVDMALEAAEEVDE